MKNICSPKDTIRRMSIEARLGEKKKTTKQASHGLLSKIYKEYLNLNENMNILTEKCTKDLNRHLTKEEVRTADSKAAPHQLSSGKCKLKQENSLAVQRL